MMETPIVGPFINQIASSICFQLCLKRIILLQQPTQDHQWIFVILHFDLWYVIILLKNAKIDLGVTTFQTLELCFS